MVRFDKNLSKNHSINIGILRNIDDSFFWLKIEDPLPA